MTAAPELASRWSALWGVLAGLLLLGTLVFPIVAQLCDPPLEPSSTLMRWQALWNDGRYGVKYNFAVTWFCTLAALCGPALWFCLAVGASRRFTRPASPMPDGPGWRALDVPHRSRGAQLRLGLALLTVSLLFGAACLLDPEIFTPIGLLAQIFLIVWPFLLVAAPALLLDALPPDLVLGPVEALEHTRPAQGQQPTFHLRVGGRSYELEATLWRELQAGDSVALRCSPAFDRVTALAVRTP